MRKLYSAASFMLLAVALPAAAQMSVDFSMVGSSVAGITTPVVLNPCTPGQCGQRSQSIQSASPRTTAKYRPTPALARAAVDAYVGRIARKNPAAASMVAAQLAKHDYRTIYRGLIAGSGLRENDAVDTITAYTVLGWMIATNHSVGVDNEKVSAARQQVAARFLSDPRFAAPGTVAKLGEEMKLLYVTLHSGWQSAQREGNLRGYSDGVRAMFQSQSGQDLRALDLTRQGFVEG